MQAWQSEMPAIDSGTLSPRRTKGALLEVVHSETWDSTATITRITQPLARAAAVQLEEEAVGRVLFTAQQAARHCEANQGSGTARQEIALGTREAISAEQRRQTARVIR